MFMDEEDLTHKLDLLRVYKRRFHILEKREAQYGSAVDPGVIIEREDVAKKIKALEQEVGRASIPSIRHSPVSGLMNSTVILDVSRIIDVPLQVLEYHLGDPVDTIWRGIESAEDIPEGGATREYKFDDYVIDINYNKSGIATSIRLFEGLEQYNYSLDDWPIILPRVGLLHVVTLPDIRGETSIIWRNYQGLTIKVASQRVGGPVTAVRVYKIAK
jgi:hypothetical protein